MAVDAEIEPRSFKLLQKSSGDAPQRHCYPRGLVAKDPGQWGVMKNEAPLAGHFESRPHGRPQRPTGELPQAGYIHGRKGHARG